MKEAPDDGGDVEMPDLEVPKDPSNLTKSQTNLESSGTSANHLAEIRD